MFLGGSVPPWAGGAEGDGSPPAANCGIRAVRPLRYSGLRQALREKKRKSLRNHEISASTVTNKFRDVVGRVTPCAPFGKLSADRGAHGVTRPTRALHDVTKLICRGTRCALGSCRPPRPKKLSRWLSNSSPAELASSPLAWRNCLPAEFV